MWKFREEELAIELLTGLNKLVKGSAAVRAFAIDLGMREELMADCCLRIQLQPLRFVALYLGKFGSGQQARLSYPPLATTEKFVIYTLDFT